MLKKLTIGTDSPGYNKDTEHVVLRLGEGTEYPDGVLIWFIRQFDDLLIQTPDGNLLVDWDVDHSMVAFDENHCMLISSRDNLKEIGNIKSTLIAFKSEDNKPIKVYLTIQRN